VEEQAGEGADRGGSLNSSQAIKPIKKALDQLAKRTDKGGKGIVRSPNVVFTLLARGNKGSVPDY